VLSLGNIGVNIIVRDVNNPPPAAAPVYEAFKEVGLEMPGISNSVQVPEPIFSGLWLAAAIKNA
jgi:hypothetical protein